MKEVFGALTWLQLPDVTASDVVSFVRSVSSEAHISCEAFLKLLAPPDQDDVVDVSAAVTDAIALPSHPYPFDCTFSPMGGDELIELYEAAAKADQVALETASSTASAKLDVARIEMRLAAESVDFSWLRETSLSSSSNPRSTLTTVYYDFTKAQCPPLWVQFTGKGTPVLSGTARVPALALEAGSIQTEVSGGTQRLDAYATIKVPFPKNGGGRELNVYTVTVVAKMNLAQKRKVFQTTAADLKTHHAVDPQYQSVPNPRFGNDGRTSAVYFALQPDRVIGAPAVTDQRWHAFTTVVDIPNNTIKSKLPPWRIHCSLVAQCVCACVLLRHSLRRRHTFVAGHRWQHLRA